MSLTVGTLVGLLDLDSKPFDEGLDGAGKKVGGLSNTAKTAMLGVGTALVGAGVKGTLAFADFDKGMREVFTLMPGITDKAMGDMTGDVKNFAREFGVLPDKVVPALYQALSAGVPPGNVFDFLETAQKAAKGGVTDLTTAVDGISSVVNAYGEDVIDATQASDLMFTAVKLGKTNFEELSASLFNVTPTAAALGVEFGDVTAALATMTAQGVPTSVATTQLRQMFVELSKSSSATSKVFQEITGKSFKDFVAEGGNVQDALKLLEDHARDSGVGINDLFGSVEAGSAALALTGEGAEGFSSALGGMADSAGATEKAFEVMDGGMSASFDRIKAAGALAFISIGESLAPMIEQFAVIVSFLLDKGAPAFEHFAGIAGAVIAGLAGIFALHYGAMAVSATVAAATHAAQVGFMVAKWAFHAAQALIHAGSVAAAWLIAMGPIPLVIAAVAGLVALIIANWETVRDTTMAVFGAIGDFLEEWWQVILVGIITGGLGLIVLAVVRNWDTIKTKTSEAFGAVVDTVKAQGGRMVAAASEKVGEVVGFFTGLPGRAVRAVGNLGSTLYNAGRDLIGGFIRGIKDRVGDVAGALGGITRGITSWKGPPEKDAVLLRPAGRLVLGGFIDGITDKVGDLRSMLGRVSSTVESGVTGAFGSPGVSAAGALAGGGLAGGYHTATVIFEVDGRTFAQIVGQPLADEIRLRAGPTF